MSNQRNANYGFTGGLQNAAVRGSSVIMNAAKDTNVEVTAESSDNLLDKPLTQEEINAKNFKPAYAYFVLFITLLARIMVQW